MLQSLRKYTQTWIAPLFMGALALSFVVWGIADVFRTSSVDTTAFTVGPVDVQIDQFQRDFRNAARGAGQVLTPEQNKLLADEVRDNMMMRVALDNLVQRLGLTAGDARVRADIQSNQAFRGPLGSFDHNQFLSVIGRANYSEDEFVAVSRKDNARGQMLRATQGGFMMPLDYARAIFAYVNETRAAEYVLVNDSAVGTIAPPADSVLEAYVKAHPDTFSTPEYRTVSIAYIGVDDMAPSISVTEKQIDEELAANHADYVTPEKREIEQITFPNEADARAAKAALDSGKTFDQLAADRKLKDVDYKLGEKTQADLSSDPDGAKAVFALALGATSAPVKGVFGYELFHVTRITPGVSKSRDEIKAALQKKLAVAKMTDMANAYTDALGGGAGVADAARKAGMKYVHAAAIDAKGLDPSGTKVAGADNPDLLAAIFKAEVGEDGDPFPSGDQTHYFAIKVDGVMPPKVRPLDQVRADALARWTAEQKLIQLKAKAAALAARANAEHSLAGVAASLGAPVQTTSALNRGSATALLTAPVVRAIYGAAPGATIFTPVEGGYLLARASGVAHPTPPQNDMTYYQGVRSLSGEIAQDTTVGLAKASEQHDGTTINQKLIDQTVSGSGGS
ncbi:MAG: SurA N-terminal domain-containing protein [Alphaproteobacteria bacterium]|nr:SurA N-terminal domain-containing protein [Alphaproteobacteria bacterium]MBL6939139.1 SurA N-terminal domain-containing protein [Alphaproteobacteria bacterium]MBL7096655.1 SurA N-terminal domain-containing protein [Alphaproteobacteria bacterium]